MIWRLEEVNPHDLYFLDVHRLQNISLTAFLETNRSQQKSADSMVKRSQCVTHAYSTHCSPLPVVPIPFPLWKALGAVDPGILWNLYCEYFLLEKETILDIILGKACDTSSLMWSVASFTARATAGFIPFLKREWHPNCHPAWINVFNKAKVSFFSKKDSKKSTYFFLFTD